MFESIEKSFYLIAEFVPCAIVTTVSFWAFLHTATTGSRASLLLMRTITHPRVMYPGAALFLAAWGYKVALWQEWL